MAWAIHIKSADIRADTVWYGGGFFTLSLNYYIPDICVLFNNTCSNVVCVITRPRIFIVDEVDDTQELSGYRAADVHGESFLSLIQI